MLEVLFVLLAILVAIEILFVEFGANKRKKEREEFRKKINLRFKDSKYHQRKDRHEKEIYAGTTTFYRSN
jgi:hypothetical protein